ncbi:MAG: aminodeoxychorismate synthase, component I [Sphingomonadales bacterium CG12_big_fil_rev_8_21_14_0_65_65_10]|uniref:aminodeoxychorismate synthase component I n=1 Tax=Blastomonas marina TaxID=1867408 RepID=UPI000CC962EB|nr:aminodeoxychorismate synthase component I [Blastomonas marina]PIW54051.1 MAG: aminodeoxychorismate synthase, component I [Sphingomonadales bacterium CG12_big_fil_rev_8_21_14_0_65_65_10]WPZ03630.1 aminodeoxychorismate synthase component I [Blastomonas marina]
MQSPFILLDDAREQGAAPTRLYRDPIELVVARNREEVAPALARIEALRAQGRHLAGYIAYEAGYALEDRLAPLLEPRTGAGPLVWFGAFDGYESFAPGTLPPGWPDDRARIGPFEPGVSQGRYLAAFARLQEAIRAGDIYQANLTFPLVARMHGDPRALYAAIRGRAAAGYGGVVFDGSDWLLSFSPELFFAQDGERVRVKPMKGTRPRGRDADEDAALRRELAGSVKDRAENLMIVDLLRNDLSRVSRPGSVRTDRLFAVESYPSVHQMVSEVRADLRPEAGIADMLRALFPCGSITGAPKLRAMELIAEVERDARGPYCGAIGRIDPPQSGVRGENAAGEAAFNVAIRTLRVAPGLNGRGHAIMGVGSAVVADSEGLAEWRECLVKGEFVRSSAAASFDLIETMRFSPEEGVPLLDFHLERVGESARTFGFAFDRHEVRNAIQALSFAAEAPARMRLLVARSGRFSLEMRALPDPAERPLRCAVLRLPVDPGDWRLRHKSTDRGFYEQAREIAQEAGADDAIFLRDDGQVTEGTIWSVFVERDDMLITPPLADGLLPGVLRRSLIEQGRAVEAPLTLDDLAGGFLLGNAVRGLVAAELIDR